MELYLFSNENGTSTGFMKTKDDILMVLNDKILRVPNDAKGKAIIEKALVFLESSLPQKIEKGKKSH